MGFIEFLHSKPFFGVHKILSNLFLGSADYLVAQSSDSFTLLEKELLHSKKNWIVGPYFSLEQKKGLPSKENAKKKLGLNGKIILFFGFVRPYKGLITLLDALPLVLEKENVTLVIAGEFWKAKEEYVSRIRELGIEKKVRIFDEFIPTEKMPAFFCCADVMVVPYRAISQSAIIPTSFSYGLPVIATRVGGNKDWIHEGKNGYLVSPTNPRALSEAIIRYYAEKKEKNFRENIEKGMSEMKWSRMKEKIILGEF